MTIVPATSGSVPSLDIWVSAVVGPLILLLITVVVGFIQRRGERPSGSPTSERYARARLKEALDQISQAPDIDEREQLAERITEARVLVEAHEARRRVLPGSARPYWFCCIVVGIYFAATLTFALAQPSVELWVLTVVLLALLAGLLILAVTADSAQAAGLGVFVSAGRYGHSDLVRADPWRVLREYDEWVTAHPDAEAARKRVDAANQNVHVKQRFERAVTSQRLWQHRPALDEDLWAAHGDSAKPRKRRWLQLWRQGRGDRDDDQTPGHAP